MTKKTKDTTTPKKSGDNSRSTGKKKTNRRESTKNPSLQPKYNLKTRTDLLDQDYLHKLNESELKWLNDFNTDYVNASMDRVNFENNIHSKTKKLKKETDKRNNDRKSCVLTRQKAAGRLKNFDEITEETLNPTEFMNMALDLQFMDIVDENGNVKKKKP